MPALTTEDQKLGVPGEPGIHSSPPSAGPKMVPRPHIPVMADMARARHHSLGDADDAVEGAHEEAREDRDSERWRHAKDEGEDEARYESELDHDAPAVDIAREAERIRGDHAAKHK
eukprot:scaffold311759_cov31-Tisochrysis_lutea.AAC.2